MGKWKNQRENPHKMEHLPTISRGRPRGGGREGIREEGVERRGNDDLYYSNLSVTFSGKN
jgi:hypothetical protein